MESVCIILIPYELISSHGTSGIPLISQCDDIISLRRFDTYKPSTPRADDACDAVCRQRRNGEE